MTRLAINDYAIEQVEALYRGGDLGDARARPLTADLLVAWTFLGIVEDEHEPPAPDESLYDAVKRCFERVLFAAYLDAMSPREHRRLYGKLLLRANKLLSRRDSRRTAPIGPMIGTENDLVQAALQRVLSGQRYWTQIGGRLKPPLDLLSEIMQSIVSHDVRTPRNKGYEVALGSEVSHDEPLGPIPETLVDPESTAGPTRILGNELLTLLYRANPKRKFEVFMMRYAGRTYREIQEATGVAQATAHRWVSEMRRDLGSHFERSLRHDHSKKES